MCQRQFRHLYVVEYQDGPAEQQLFHTTDDDQTQQRGCGRAPRTGWFPGYSADA